MNHKFLRVSVLTMIVLALVLSGASCLAQQPPTQVHVITVDGTVELGLSQYVLRGLKQAQRDQAAVLLEINTFGGVWTRQRKSAIISCGWRHRLSPLSGSGPYRREP